MVLKGLAAGGALVAVAIAVYAAFVLRPAAPATGVNLAPAQAVNSVLAPNGLALPQLQPVQPASAPAFINDVSSVNLTLPAGERAEVRAIQPVSESTSANAAGAVEGKALMGCGGE